MKHDTQHNPASATTSAADDLHADPPRVIGPLAAFNVVAGSMLGVGIFLFAPKIAASMGSELGFFLMLLFGGVFAWAGSVACGELGAMMPKAGGDYVFQREAFGPSMAFASGWVLFVAIFAGSTASMSVAVFQFDIGPIIGVDMMSPLWPAVDGESAILGHITGGHLAALCMIVLLTFLNDLGTAVAATAQTVLTVAPIAALVVIGIWGLVAGEGRATDAVQTVGAPLTLSGLGAAFLFANFIFSGWINIIYVASEVKDPGKTIPRAMVSAVFSVTGLYVLLGFAFIAVLGFGGFSQTFEAGTAMAGKLGGPAMEKVILVIISVAIITSINATILAAARVGYAMARDGAFVKAVGRLSPKTRTPRTSLWVQAVIAMIIVLSGTFEAIVKMTSIAMFVTGSLTVLAVFVLRRTRADMPRPYRATFYPVLPALYVVCAVAAIGLETERALNPAKDDATGWFPLLGVGLLVLTWVGHLVYRRNVRGAVAVVGAVLVGGFVLKHAGDAPESAHAAGIPKKVATAADSITDHDETRPVEKVAR